MRLILLSGGSGKRLWPLSNDARSKQFLKILQGPDNQFESMVQRIWRQLNNVGLAEHSIIATGPNQVDMIVNQLGAQVPIIVEPERRDTFAAVALSAAYLYSVLGVSLNETVVVMPVDSYVDDVFFNKIKEMDRVLNQSSANLVLMGASPTYPSAKYGYMVPDLSPADEAFFKVKHFHEKPTEEKARSLIETDNAFWNCGVFAFKLDYLITLLYDKGIPLQYEQLVKQYHVLKKTSFDYEVVEKELHIAMLPYEGDWKDLGTWNTLTEEMAAPQIGICMSSSDSHNTHIINELHIPVSVLGLSNIVVVVSPDGVLVSDKQASPRLKEVITFEQRPMFEEHQWGTSKVLDFSEHGMESEVLTKRIRIEAGKQTGIEVHFKRMEIWNVISGTGEIYLDGKIISVQKGFTCLIPPRMQHGIKAISELELIEIQEGSPLSSDDIVNFSFSWESAVV
ncbi:sugar phosphate nucleotidyltransferase [Cohnella suwonensis]|uniref:Sugar phosphate nucleotidyltransferase n=1 Tax=Cohnella suwonensis TaxID=696072 RepID=A0ABW0M303_9BACL